MTSCITDCPLRKEKYIVPIGETDKRHQAGKDVQQARMMKDQYGNVMI